MAYIGNNLNNDVSINQYEYTATAGQTTFYCTYEKGVDVYINGMLLSKTDYAAVDGVSVILNVACTAGQLVTINCFKSQMFGRSTTSRQTYTATASQTVFAIQYDIGFIDVYRNGLKLATSDFTASNGTTIVLNNACSLNDVVDIVAYGTFELADAYTKNDTDVLLNAKANQATTYTKTEADSLLGAKANSATTYTKTEVDNKPTGFKNRIINGAMRIDQRNSGSSVTVNSTADLYCTDRWNGRLQHASGAFTMQQSTTAPSNFVNSFLLTVTNTTAATVTSRVHTRQIIEGFNIADLGWGTANARSITLSFWVRSSVIGTYGVGFINSSETRSYVGTYVINSANTFEYKTITISGDSTGTWETGNGNGIRVTFDLGSGTNYNAASANTWVAQEACRTSSCVNWQQNSGATLYISGVQLEEGSVATPFENRPYGLELSLCQRYYESTGTTAFGNAISFRGYVVSGADYTAKAYFQVTKRAAPTVSFTNEFNIAFPSTPSAAGGIGDRGFNETRTANASSNSGLFSTYYTASAEL